MRNHSFAAKPLALLLGLAAVATAQAAEVTLPTVDLGVGMRSSFTSTSYSGGAAGSSSFSLDSVRLYINGKVDDHIKLTFNTEYTGSPPGGQNTVQVMDAIGRFEMSPAVNVWVGRFLPPADRANLYGSYYANDWSVYTDGVQDGYPSVAVGRDNGAAYWGDFDKFKFSVGVFGVPGMGATRKTLKAARAQVDFWDAEPGYYQNGTYYGDKDILALGLAGQEVDDKKSAYSLDFLMEKKLGGGALSLESEYTKYDGLGGYDGHFNASNGYYGLVAYLFPEKVGPGKVQLLLKSGRTSFDESSSPTYHQNTTEGNLNYIVKGFNARFSLFVRRTSYSDNAPSLSNTAVGIGTQLQF